LFEVHAEIVAHKIDVDKLFFGTYTSITRINCYPSSL
jgi:hypothetical protein